MTVKDIFDVEFPKRLQENPDIAKNIGVVIHFDITGDGGGLWTLDGTKSADWIAEGNIGKAEMTLTCTAANFQKLVAKQMNAQMAAMSGKLSFEPLDIGLAMRLSKLMG